MSKNSKTKQKTGTILSFVPTGEYYFTKGLKAYQRGDFHKSIKYLERAMQLDPGEPLIPFQLAIVLTESGDYQKSNRLLHTILEENDEDMAECHYFLANNYAHLGLFKDAYHHATLYLEMDEDGEFADDTEDLLDLLTLEAEELEDSLYEQDELISQQEEARELLESGQFTEAVKLFNALIKGYPEYWSAYNNLALAYFYLGQGKKADDTLNEVLEKNPGNLHALCNKLVFAYYNKDKDKVTRLKNALMKIKPIMLEHQFKLGATFALIGEYEAAYSLLIKLKKQGFEGEEPYYYWLSHSAFFTGREKTAKKSWQKVIQMNPEKEGLEPWNKAKASRTGSEAQFAAISNKLESNLIEERLFALFLASISDKKEAILSSYNAKTNLEKQYLSLIQNRGSENPIIDLGHKTAKQLYQFHQLTRTDEAGLYLLWFSIIEELEKEQITIKNDKACAAAVEYVWRKLRNEKQSQNYFAKQYNLSVSTMQKYVKIVNRCLR